MTYGANGPILDADKFKEYPSVNLMVDECYTTFDRAVKYTMVHFVNRTRQSTVEKFMSYASTKYDIVPTEVFGYSGISANNSSNELISQVGFQMLLRHKIDKNPSFRSFIENPRLRGGGILETYKRKQLQSKPGEHCDDEEDQDLNLKKRSHEEISKDCFEAAVDNPEGMANIAQLESGTTDALKMELKQSKEDAEKYKQLAKDLEEKLEEATTKVAELEKKTDADLVTSKDETASYKKSAEFYETQYNDYKDQMEDAGVVGSTEYYKKKAEDLEKKFNGLNGSTAEVEKLREHYKELNTKYAHELQFAEQREGEIFDLKDKVLIVFILVHTLELTTPLFQVGRLKGEVEFHKGHFHLSGKDLHAPDDPVVELHRKYEALEKDHRNLKVMKVRVNDELKKARDEIKEFIKQVILLECVLLS